MIPEEIKKRIDNVEYRSSGTNCAGTALYVAGLISKDMAMSPGSGIDYYLLMLSMSDEPIEGGLFAIRKKDGTVGHMGVVFCLEQEVCVFHRRGSAGYTRIETLDSATAGYDDGAWDIEFYKPEIMRKEEALRNFAYSLITRK